MKFYFSFICLQTKKREYDLHTRFLIAYIANSKTGLGFREIFQSGKGFDTRNRLNSTAQTRSSLKPVRSLCRYDHRNIDRYNIRWWHELCTGWLRLQCVGKKYSRRKKVRNIAICQARHQCEFFFFGINDAVLSPKAQPPSGNQCSEMDDDLI